MAKKTYDRFDWRLPFYGVLAAVTVFLPLVLLSADAVFLYVPFTVSVVLVLLLLAILGEGGSRLSILSMLVVYGVTSWPLIENFRTIRPTLRWFLWSRQFKAAVLAQPDPLYGGLKHMEWDGWGFAFAGDTSVYLVYAPGNPVNYPGGTLASAATNHFSGDLADLPEGVYHIQRLEASWYSVVFYADVRWTDNIPQGDIFPP